MARFFFPRMCCYSQSFLLSMGMAQFSSFLMIHQVSQRFMFVISLDIIFHDDYLYLFSLSFCFVDFKKFFIFSRSVSFGGFTYMSNIFSHSILHCQFNNVQLFFLLNSSILSQHLKQNVICTPHFHSQNALSYF